MDNNEYDADYEEYLREMQKVKEENGEEEEVKVEESENKNDDNNNANNKNSKDKSKKRDYADIQYKSISDYNNIQTIRENFESLRNINIDPEFDEDYLKNCKFYIIRSKNEDDVHKAMKYGVWTSSERNNIRINKQANYFWKNGYSVFFLFVVFGKNKFNGMCELTSEYDDDLTFNYWSEPAKWEGVFNIDWIFVHDIPFENINFTQNFKTLEEMRDGFELEPNNAIMIYNKYLQNIIAPYSVENTLFNKFIKLDKKEIMLRENRDIMVQTGMMDVYKKKETTYKNVIETNVVTVTKVVKKKKGKK